MMKKNIGLSDRLIRFVIALLIFSYALWQKSWLAGAVSVFVFYEALAGWCVYYQLIGKSSCPIESQEAVPDQSRDKFTKLLICLFLCFGVGLTASWFTQESVDTWYQTLKKPWWTPPDVAFPVAWTILYIMMALSLWIISIKPAYDKTAAYIAFCVQLFFNFAWSWLFFYLKEPMYALFDMVLLLGAITVTISFFWRLSPLAGFLLFPYLAWVAFAASINLYILFLN